MGEFGCREVVEPYANPDKAIIRIELLAPDGGLEVIEATANHPFYVEGQGWTRVDELDVGDFVPGSTGELLRIVALESTDRVETVFNFGVEEFHSYFVGELGAWVHNCNKNSTIIVTHPSKRAARRAAARDAGFGKHEELVRLKDQDLNPGSKSPKGDPGVRIEYQSVDSKKIMHYDPYGHYNIDKNGVIESIGPHYGVDIIDELGKVRTKHHLFPSNHDPSLNR